MTVSFLPGQEGTEQEPPIPYTASPLRLLWADIRLFFRSIPYLPGLVRPLTPCRSGPLCELYPSPQNIFVIATHLLLSIIQIAFLASLPLCVVFLVPAIWIGAYAVAFYWVNCTICAVCFNGCVSVLESIVPETERPENREEHWIFINGVGVGNYWLQHTIDRLAYTFGRRVTGVHNETSGIVFDIIQCLIQRNFSYATQDIRDAYALTKDALVNPEYRKVVLVLHSQGAIEGGLILDWLLDEMPQHLLRQLEVYTFGNAANHFNNPCKTTRTRLAKQEAGDKSIRHIEHYANSEDFVSVWGLLNFVNIPNRYMGQVFIRPGSGHQLVQHYMDAMFPLGPDKRALESNPFMDMEVEVTETPGCSENESNGDDQVGGIYDGSCRALTNGKGIGIRGLKVRDLSRLWMYRNGQRPAE
ncbi:hypothetical protein FE257_010233 [Aspergillus nanangensis]|uniref:Uncharacterized protein n=1 Tax=Aspergillus nanangensis TaxID=2582783 RepID=A0AAD4CJJ2_ASPNN|nr:hypothetical protein FE257_010233 [Aspergillus nanangensis]